MTNATANKSCCPRAVVSEPRRWALASVGLACVGLGALGVFVPGLPTTIFLILASWCFTRSCPWLEERVRRFRIFGPFFRVIDTGQRMPLHARIVSLILMWTAISVSTWVLMHQGLHPAIWGSIIAAGLVGTVAIVRL